MLMLMKSRSSERMNQWEDLPLACRPGLLADRFLPIKFKNMLYRPTKADGSLINATDSISHYGPCLTAESNAASSGGLRTFSIFRYLIGNFNSTSRQS